MELNQSDVTNITLASVGKLFLQNDNFIIDQQNGIIDVKIVIDNFRFNSSNLIN